VRRIRHKEEQSGNDATEVSSALPKPQVPAPHSPQESTKPQTSGISSSLKASEQSEETHSPPPRPKPEGESSQLSNSVRSPDSPQRTVSQGHQQLLSDESNRAAARSGEPKAAQGDSRGDRLPRGADPAGDLWSKAYDELKGKDDTKRLMETYETILSSEKLYNMMTEKKDRDDRQTIDIGTTLY